MLQRVLIVQIVNLANFLNCLLKEEFKKREFFDDNYSEPIKKPRQIKSVSTITPATQLKEEENNSDESLQLTSSISEKELNRMRKAEIRKENNRLSAMDSRRRKKLLIETLEAEKASFDQFKTKLTSLLADAHLIPSSPAMKNETELLQIFTRVITDGNQDQRLLRTPSQASNLPMTSRPNL